MGRKGKGRRKKNADREEVVDTCDDKSGITAVDNSVKLEEEINAEVNLQEEAHETAEDTHDVKEAVKDVEVEVLSSRDGIKFYPFAYALYNSELRNHCWYCLAESKSLRRCVGCNEGLYCSRECHLLGWKDHKLECKGLKYCDGVIPDIEIRLLGRIVVRYKAIKSGKDKSDPNFYLNRTSRRSVMDIWAHVDMIRNDPFAMKKFTNVYDGLARFYGAKSLPKTEEVFELHCRDYINRHGISDKAFLKEIGKGLYLDLCAYDHSCKPNAIFTCNGFTATLRALDSSTNLFDRDSTFYTYIDLLNTTEERKKQLKDTWYFDCKCLRCCDNEDGLLSSILCPNCPKPKALRIFGRVPYKDESTQLIVCPDCDKELSRDYVVEAIGAMRFIQRLIDDKEIEQMSSSQQVSFLEDLRSRFSTILPKVNIFSCRIIQLLIALTESSNYEKLLELHLDSEECVRFCYPTNHPAVAVHLQNIGLFYLRTNQPHRGKFYLECARERLNFVLGVDHYLSREIDKIIIEATAEVESAKKLLQNSMGINRIKVPSPVQEKS